MRFLRVKEGWLQVFLETLHYRLDHDELCKVFADGEARIADLTDEIVLAGNEPNDLILAESDFAEAVLNFRCGAKFLDAHGHARLHAAQRAHFAARFNF